MRFDDIEILLTIIPSIIEQFHHERRSLVLHTNTKACMLPLPYHITVPIAFIELIDNGFPVTANG